VSGIGVILNPNSRLNIKSPDRIERLGFIVGDKGSCHATKSLEDVENLAQTFKEREIEIIGISGGDGTYQQTLTRIIQVYGKTTLPKIALLGGGTMNDIVTCFGIRGTPEMILTRLITKYHQDVSFKQLECPILKVNDQYGFLFGNGVLYRFIANYNKVENSTRLTAARMLLQDVSSGVVHGPKAMELLKRIDTEVLVDGKEWPFKNYSSLICGTIKTLGFGFNALYRARSQAGKFQIIGCSLTPRQLITSFPQILLNQKIKSDNWLDAMTSHISIKYETPEGHTLDGEIFGPYKKVDISLGPTLKLVIA